MGIIVDMLQMSSLWRGHSHINTYMRRARLASIKVVVGTTHYEYALDTFEQLIAEENITCNWS